MNKFPKIKLDLIGSFTTKIVDSQQKKIGIEINSLFLHFKNGEMMNKILSNLSKKKGIRNQFKLTTKFILLFCIIFFQKVTANTYTVSNTNDAGAGSFRQAIIDANANAGADIIQFTTSGLLTLASALPNITGTVDIQGETATGYVVGTPTFQIHTPSNIWMLYITGAGAAGTRVNGLNLSSTGGRAAFAVYVNADNVTVTNCWLKTRNISVYANGCANPTIQNNDFTGSGADANNPQLYLSSVTGIVASAVSGNTWGGTSESFLRMNNIMQAITISDGSVAGSHIIIPDGSAGSANLSGYGIQIYDGVGAGQKIIDNVDFARSTARNGSGILIQSCTNPIVQNCNLNNRSASVFSNGCTNPFIIGNSAISSGYAVYINAGSNPIIQNNDFTNAGIDINNPKVYFNSVTGIVAGAVSGNTWGGTSESFLRMNNIMQAITISDGSVAGSHIIIPDGSAGSANLSGYGIQIYDGVGAGQKIIDNVDLGRSTARNGNGIIIQSCTNPIVQNCNVINRSGSIYSNGCTNPSIIGNSAISSGYAVYINAGSNPIIQNNDFTNAGIDINNPKVYFNSVTGIVANAVSGNNWNGTSESFLRLQALTQNIIVSDGSVAGSHIIIPDASVLTAGLSGYGIYVNGCSGGMTFDNIDLSKSAGRNGYGFLIQSSPNVSILNSNLSTRWISCYYNSSNNPTIQNNNFTDSGLDVNNPQVYLVSVSGIVSGAVTGNTWGGNTESLLRLQSLTQNITVSDGSVAGSHIVIADGSVLTAGLSGYGVYVNGCSGGMTFDNIDLSKSAGRNGYGFLIQSSPNVSILNSNLSTRWISCNYNSSSNPTIQNNNFTNSGSDINNPQVYLNGVSGIVAGAVTGNTWGGNTESLLRLQSLSQNITISDGSVAGSHIVIADGSVLTAGLSGYGIYVNGCSGGMTFDNIDLSKSAGRNGYGFLIQSSPNVSILNSNLSTRWISCYYNSSNNPTIQNNNFSNSGSDINNPQVYLNGVSGFVAGAVTGNTWGGNTESLLRLQSLTQNITVSDGSVAGSHIVIADGSVLTAGLSGYGIYVNGCSGGMTFDNIDLSKSAGRNGYGFLIQSSPNVSILNSNLSTRWISCYFNGSNNPTIQNNNFTDSGLDINNPQVYLNGVNGVLAGAVTGNTWGGNTGCFLRINSMTQAFTVSDGSVAGSHLVIPDGSTLNSITSTNYIIYLTSCTGGMTFDNVDFSYNTVRQGIGIYSNSVTNLNVSNCNFTNRHMAVEMLNSTNPIIQNNNFTDVGLGGTGTPYPVLSFTNSSALAVNAVSGNNWAGSHESFLRIVQNNTQALLISDGSVANSHIIIPDGSALTSGFVNGGCSGILLNNCSQPITIDNLDLTKALCTGVQGIAISYSSCTNVSIQNCSILNRTRAIDLSGTNPNTIISCNSLQFNTLAINFAGTNTANSVINNSFFNNTNSIAQSGTAVTATNNYWGGTIPIVSTANGFTGTVSVSPFLTSPSCAPILLPEIDLVGNGISIVSGDVTPSTSDDTDYGNVGLLTSVAKTFTITNSGTVNLTVSAISMTGVQASEFIISGITLPVTISPNSSTTFVVTATPTATGARNATVNITHTDCNENVYTYTVRTNGVNAAEINVLGNSLSILDGDISPIITDHTNFGNISSNLSRTFTIQNTGNTNLTVSTIVLSGVNASDFNVSGITLPATIAGGASTTFNIDFVYSSGVKYATVVINNSDVNEAVYDFAIAVNTFDNKRGNMYTFDGIDDKLSISTSGLPQGNAARTIEAWVKTTQASIGNIVSWGTRTNNQRSSIAVRSGKFAWIGEFADLTGTITINDGQWHHVACVYNSTILSLYVDGKLDVSFALNHNTTGNNLLIGTIATPSTGEFFAGSIDEVRIWNIARTQAQIRENMHLTLTGSETGLVSYYQFNLDGAVGSANSVIDAYGSKNLTASGMTAGSYVASEVSVGGGSSDRATVAAGAGSTFTGTNTQSSITFGATTPNGEIVVSRIWTEAPHAWASTGAAHTFDSYYVIDNYGSNATFAPIAILTLRNNGSISTDDLTSSLSMYKRASNAYGATWGTTLGNPVSITPGYAQNITFDVTNNITSFSSILITSDSPLPVEKLELIGQRVSNDQVSLQWNVGKETNVGFYTIERKLDNENEFKEVSNVMASGIPQYQKIDANDYSKVSYYRIKQFDLNGDFTYSNQILVTGSDQNQLVLYPNPNNGSFQIIGTGAFEVKVTDMLGKEILKTQGTDSVNILMPDEISKGMYLVHVIKNATIQTSKVQVVK